MANRTLAQQQRRGVVRPPQREMVEWPDRAEGFGKRQGYGLQKGYWSTVIAVTYHDDLKEVQSDAQLARLLGAGSPAAPFDRLDWWQGLVEECDFFPLIAVAREGEFRAVLPMYRVKRRIDALANWYNFTVRHVISPGADRAGLLKELAEDLVGQAPHIILSPLPDDFGEATELETALRGAGWTVFRDIATYNHVLPVAGRSFDEYFATRPGHLRTLLARKSAKVSVTVETRFVSESWQAYEAIYENSWKPREGSPAFLRRFAEHEGAAGRLRLGIARADGQPVAAQFWTIDGGIAYIHKLAHLEAAKPLSPGSILSAAMFRHAIDEDRVALVDFGNGNDAYKADWMEQVRPRYRLEAFRPRWPGNWPLIARRLAGRLAGRAKHV